MHPEQLARIKRRRAEKRARPIVPADPRVGRAPTPTELAQLDGLIALEKQRAVEREIAERVAPMFDRAIIAMDRTQAWHWLWRAEKLVLAQKKHGWHHNHPINEKGNPERIWSYLGLPRAPQLQKLFDDKVAVVPKRVKSLPQKGNVPIIKTVGFREVDEDCADFWLHSRGFDLPKRIDVVIWMEKVVACIESGDLVARIRGLETLYGVPANVLAISTAITPAPAIRMTPTPRLTSAGRVKGSSVARRFGARGPKALRPSLNEPTMRRSTPMERAARMEKKLAERNGAFFQDQALIRKAYNRELFYGRNDD